MLNKCLKTKRSLKVVETRNLSCGLENTNDGCCVDECPSATVHLRVWDVREVFHYAKHEGK